MADKPELLNEQAAAAYIGMSVGFLRVGRYQGIVGNRTPTPPYHKLGFSVRYSVEDLNAWLAERRVDPVRRKRSATGAR